MTAVSGLHADFPGDTIRIALLIRGNKIGDVRIQDYGQTARNRYRIGAFLPGYQECPEGDTPKTYPDYDAWCASNADADAKFDEFLKAAHARGWKDYNRETGKAA